MISDVVECPIVQLNSAVLILTLPRSLCPSVHFTGRAGQEVQTLSALCGLVVVATTKTTECYQHFFSSRTKTQHHNRHYEEN